jgi:PAS domain S-box-containing protein
MPDFKFPDSITSATLQAMPDAVVAVDSRGVIRFVNTNAEKLCGYESSELVGERVEILVPASRRSSHKRNIDSYHSAPTAREMGDRRDLGLRKKDGTIVPVVISLSPLDGLDEQIVLSTIRDVSDRERRSKEEFLLAEIGTLVSAEHDIENVYHLLESTLPTLFKYDRIVISAIHADRDLIERLFVSGIESEGNDAGTYITAPIDRSTLFETAGFIQSSVPASAIDGTNSSAGRHAEAGLKSWLRVPLGDRDNPTGVLGLRSVDENAYDEDDLSLLERVAASISPAFENARLYAQVKQEVYERTMLAEIGKAVSSSTNVSEFFDEFAELSKQLIPFDAMAYSDVNLDLEVITLKYWHGFDLDASKIYQGNNC